MPTARYCLTTCVFDDNIFAIGGWKHSASGPLYDKVEIYNPESDEWSTGQSLPVARSLLAGIVLNDRIYVYGGTHTTHPNFGTFFIVTNLITHLTQYY
jgi:N-acetylneuraminic acid mutarotase